MAPRRKVATTPSPASSPMKTRSATAAALSPRQTRSATARALSPRQTRSPGRMRSATAAAAGASSPRKTRIAAAAAAISPRQSRIATAGKKVAGPPAPFPAPERAPAKKRKGKATAEKHKGKAKAKAKGKATAVESRKKIREAESEPLLQENLQLKELLPPGWKSKKVWYSSSPSYSKKELGQSSNALLIEEELYCSICMEMKPHFMSFSIKSCSHKFCMSCVGQYIAAKVEENLTSIGCPDPNCKDGILEPEMCRQIIPSEVFDRWGIALCESLLGSRKFYCPYKDCSALLVNESSEEGGVIMESECPHCNRLFCAQCRVPWHAGFGCKAYQLLGEDERSREDLMLRKLATKSKWQRCPHCRMYVEKIAGCKFMMCRCGYCFCYACAFPMSKETHYCEKCKS